MQSAVHLLSLGGTIAMTAGADGAAPTLTAQELAAAVPALDRLAEVSVTSVRQAPGASLGFADLVATAEEARRRVAAGAAGVVVTQGTDSLEESAFLLDLLWDLPEPLIVTGAMRHPSLAGADGPGNLHAAVAVAVSPEARARGCVVVFGDEIHASRYVAKVHGTRLAAFASPGAGPVGLVHEGTARFWAPPPPRERPALVAASGPAPRVTLVSAVLGGGGEDIEAAAASGADGIVLAAMGGGHVPERMLAAITGAVARVPVVLASRTGAGPVLRRTYAFPGSEQDLRARGLLDAGDLSPLKARILLTAALWQEDGRGACEEVFRRWADPVSAG